MVGSPAGCEEDPAGMEGGSGGGKEVRRRSRPRWVAVRSRKKEETQEDGRDGWHPPGRPGQEEAWMSRQAWHAGLAHIAFRGAGSQAVRMACGKVFWLHLWPSPVSPKEDLLSPSSPE
jgi:hypothetical protein